MKRKRLHDIESKGSLHRDFYLCHRALKGDDEALNQLFEGADEMLLAFFQKHWSKSPLGGQEIGDLVCITLQTALRRLGNYKGSSSFAAWLMGIGRNTVYKAFERKDLYEQRNQPLNESGESWEEDPLDLILEQEKIRALYQALERLSPDLREIVLAKVVGNMTFTKIAAIFQIDRHTASGRYRQGIEQLKEYFLGIYTDIR